MTLRILADIEALVVTYLRDHEDVEPLVGTRIATRSNEVLPCIRVQLIGGSPFVTGYATRARVQIEAWAAADQEPAAREIAATAYAAVLGINGTGGIRGVYDDAVVSDAEEALALLSSPDPVTSRSRYLFDVTIAYHLVRD